jgi:hypothetical protein
MARLNIVVNPKRSIQRQDTTLVRHPQAHRGFRRVPATRSVVNK